MGKDGKKPPSTVITFHKINEEEWNQFFNRLDLSDEHEFEVIGGDGGGGGDGMDGSGEEEKPKELTRAEYYQLLRDEIPSPAQIVDHLDEFVVGQEDAKREVAVALVNHMFRAHYNMVQNRPDEKIRKSNLLLIGDSGCGKTYIVETASRLLEVPYVCVDATRFSATGYVGGNVEDILTQLLMAADGELEEAERGIVFIDEFDKLARANSADKDVNTTQVQRGLLKICEGGILPVPESFSDRAKDVMMDTSEILFVFAGAFDGIVSKRAKESAERYSVGFVNSADESDNGKVNEEDLIKYGIIPEILGRIGQYVTLQALTSAQLMQVLREVRNNPVDHAKKLFKLRFPEKRFPLTNKDYKEIIEGVKNSKLGVRGLAREVHRRMMKHYYS
jgi:ATP-dependent Clp protease ATP-binding subunit ClpX